jgi:RNA polymerase sigma-70 factor, ECF subfamily
MLTINRRLPTATECIEINAWISEEISDLMERAKLGDVNAFERLVGLYERGLFLVILRITKHREDAEDVMQDALRRVCMNIKTFWGESRFNTWLTRIGINHALMCLRARR